MFISREQPDKAVAVARDFGATRLVLFGTSSDDPARARDLDLACDGVEGWKLYQLAARLEETLRTPLVPCAPHAAQPVHSPHVEMFQMFCDPPRAPLPCFFDAGLAAALGPFRRFRHVVHHGYEQLDTVFGRLKARLDEYLQNIARD